MKRRGILMEISPRVQRFAVLLSLLSVCLLPAACNPKTAPTVEKVTIAFPLLAGSSLIHVANEKGFFREEGLEVTSRHTSSGKDALDALIAGNADFAGSAETPVVFAALKGEGILIVAETMNTTKNIAIVALRSRGIESPNDLKGKRIGYTPGTNLHFFVDTFLTVHGIPIDSVRNVSLKPDDMRAALRSGKVDAVAVWQPYILEFGKEFGTGAVTFFDEAIYTWTSVVTVGKKFAADRPGAVKKFLRALLKAEAFVRERPAETVDIMARGTGTDRGEVERSMQSLNFNVRLDPSLLVNLESQARWAIRDKMTDRKDVPNLLEYIYLDGLKAVKPDAVTVTQ
jgi:ABC-type nitrate/sulfonate/bicarbonate transport system substrate-binding protein